MLEGGAAVPGHLLQTDDWTNVLTDLGYRLGIFNEEAHLEWAALSVGTWATERPVSKLTAFRLITGGRVFILPSDHSFSSLGSLGRIFVRPDARRDRYEMNFEYMPELNWTLGYPFALLLMVLVSVSLYLVFKRLGWL